MLWRLLILTQFANTTTVCYAVVIVLAKSSVIIPLISTFTPNKKTWLYWSYVALISLNVGFWISGGLAVLFACTPREKIWNPFLPGNCINQNTLFLTSSAWNIFTDLWIIILPLFSIWHLRLAMRYKVGVSIMFLTTILSVCQSSNIVSIG